MRGRTGNDHLIDGLGNDVLNGGAGDHRFVIVGGNDMVTGGAGDDLVILDGNFADWRSEFIDHSTVKLARGDQTVTDIWPKLLGSTIER